MVLLQGELPQGMPHSTLPAGLTHGRQAYLYRHIKPCVGEEKRDIVCPRPATPQPPSQSSQSPSSSDSDTDSSDVPLSKRAMVEGHGAGHAEPAEAGTEDVPCK